MGFVVKRNLKMNKKAWTISWAEVISLFLIVVVLLTVSDDLYAGIKKIAARDSDSEAKQQLDNLISYVKADIENIKKLPEGQIYPLGIDGTKYALSFRNCEVADEGKCAKEKTQLCLKIINVDAKDICSKEKLNFAFNDEGSDFYITGKEIIIKWENNRLSLSSS